MQRCYYGSILGKEQMSEKEADQMEMATLKNKNEKGYDKAGAIEERKPLGYAQKQKCPKCRRVLRKVGKRLKCTKKCGFECGKNAEICSCCGVVLDEEH
jgi:hypothetical protein